MGICGQGGLSALGRPSTQALATLTCTGVFLFTRILIPEALLSLFLCVALYAFLLALDPTKNLSSRPKSAPFADAVERPAASAIYPYILWTALALAVLTKGLIALVFFFGTALVYLALTGTWKHWRRLKPFSGFALFLLIVAPWHILASLRNTGGSDGHGFFWFYFINEHFLRFLGRRIPRDYNKLPGYLYWLLHAVWLFPWSLFACTGSPPKRFRSLVESQSAAVLRYDSCTALQDSSTGQHVCGAPSCSSPSTRL